MVKKQNSLFLAIKGVIFIYLPLILLLHIIYNLVLERSLIVSWRIILIYSVIVGISTAKNYKYNSMEMDIVDFTVMEDSIIKGRWKIINKSEDILLIKPTFNFPTSIFIDDTVGIKYSEGKIFIEGPWYYVKNLVKDINGESNIWTSKVTSVAIFLLVAFLLSYPIVDDSGVFWEIKKIRHNIYVKNVEAIDINPNKVIGNSIMNTNNYGSAVENDKYIFYIEGDLNLIRVDKDFQNKKHLIQGSQGTGISRLNIAGDWIYYSRGKSLNRISIDGGKEETIYKLDYFFDIHMKDNWIYFINFYDDFVYKMDLNGRNFESFLEIRAEDIAIYGDRMLFSHVKDEKGYVESIGLDGSDRRLEFEDIARDLIRSEDYYYYIGKDYRLYRRAMDESTGPKILVDGEVSSYMLADNRIYYSLYSEEVGFPGKEVYKIELDGSGKTLIIDEDEIKGFAQVGDWLLFHSSSKQFEPTLKRINLSTDKIEIVE